MSAIKKIHKDDIIDVSLKIIRNDGIQGLNARRIAKELGCSTQPIFYYYESMDDIKTDALKKISEIFDESMIKSNYDKVVYKDIGINYIRFAKNEPVFFKLLFNSDANQKTMDFIELTGLSDKIFQVISKQTGLSCEEIKNFHFKMWLYVNGIANLVANNTCEFNDGQIQKLLEDQYISMLLFEIQKGNIGKKVLENMINNKLKYKDN